MNARIISLYSIGINDLSEYQPADAKNFFLSVRLIAGPADGEGEESFDFAVCTAAWLADSLASDEVRLVRHVLLVDHFDYERIYNYVDTYVRSCVGATWDEVAEKLSRLGYWEFEDYVNGHARE